MEGAEVEGAGGPKLSNFLYCCAQMLHRYSQAKNQLRFQHEAIQTSCGLKNVKKLLMSYFTLSKAFSG